MNLSVEQTTLVVAIIAAVTSLSTLIITFIFNISTEKSSEMRVSYRQSLEKYIPDLSESLHAIIATTNILTKAKSEESINTWRERSEKAQATLKDLRCKLRYSLWGITDAINTLTRLPDWIEHARGFQYYSTDLCTKGALLKEEIDEVVRKAYKNGRPPKRCEISKVSLAREKLEKAYDAFQNNKDLP